MFGCLLGQIHFRDPDFLSVELVEGTSVIAGPKCNKGPSVIDYEQSLFFLGPLSKSPETRK